jgi:hypothetical protein
MKPFRSPHENTLKRKADINCDSQRDEVRRGTMSSDMNDKIRELSTDELNLVSGGDKSTSAKGSTIEISDYSFGIKQALNIGSQSSGAGAGKVTFNPF